MERNKRIRAAIAYLERTAWGRGVFVGKMAVPAARPAQIRAGARKLVDRLSADRRRLAKAEV